MKIDVRTREDIAQIKVSWGDGNKSYIYLKEEGNQLKVNLDETVYSVVDKKINDKRPSP